MRGVARDIMAHVDKGFFTTMKRLYTAYTKRCLIVRAFLFKAHARG